MIIPTRWSGRTWKRQFCQLTWCPSRVNPGPSGWETAIGGAGEFNGPSDATSYSAVAVGTGTAPSSTTRSTFFWSMSTITVSPSICRGQGFRTRRASLQPTQETRRPRWSGVPKYPGGPPPQSMKVRSVKPRRFIAAMKSGCFFTSDSIASNSSRSQLGCTPLISVQDTRRSFTRSTTASKVRACCLMTAWAERVTGCPARQLHTWALAGSSSRASATRVLSL